MKKQMLKSALIALAGVGLMSGSALAYLPSIGDDYSWSSADYWTITDLSKGQAEFELSWENGSASYESSFGIYSLSNSTTIFNTLQIFDAFQEPNPDQQGTATTSSVWFKYDTSTNSWWAKKGKSGTYIEFGTVFGFYSDIYTNDGDKNKDYTWYTDTAIQQIYSNNSVEHFFIAYSEEDHNTVIYLEDLPNGNSQSDSVDLKVSSSDITPVPEPTTMLMFGAGLVGLASFARRKKA